MLGRVICFYATCYSLNGGVSNWVPEVYSCVYQVPTKMFGDHKKQHVIESIIVKAGSSAVCLGYNDIMFERTYGQREEWWKMVEIITEDIRSFEHGFINKGLLPRPIRPKDKSLAQLKIKYLRIYCADADIMEAVNKDGTIEI
uniref:Uncharacterized protein n=1 Tax=Amphimedon queenslandica TaxID=400682 RepID=A0A1X7UB60_AMPQE